MSEFLTFKSEETAMTESTPPVTPSLRLTRLCQREHLDVADFVKVQGQDVFQHWSGAMIPEIEVLRDLATRSGLVAHLISEVFSVSSEVELMERRAAFNVELPKWGELVKKIGQESLFWWKTIRV